MFRRTPHVWAVVFLTLFLGGAVAVAAPPDDTANGADTPPSEMRPYLSSLSVSDLDAAVKWYGDVLGFREDRRMNLAEYKLRIGFLERDGYRLELIEFRDSVAYRTITEKFPEVTDRAKVQGYCKLGFAVDDIEKFASILKAKKAKFQRDITRDTDTGETWLMIEDMDGNELQFFEMRRAPKQ